MHNQYNYTDVSKCCESLTNSGNPPTNQTNRKEECRWEIDNRQNKINKKNNAEETRETIS